MHAFQSLNRTKNFMASINRSVWFNWNAFDDWVIASQFIWELLEGRPNSKRQFSLWNDRFEDLFRIIRHSLMASFQMSFSYWMRKGGSNNIVHSGLGRLRRHLKVYRRPKIFTFFSNKLAFIRNDSFGLNRSLRQMRHGQSSSRKSVHFMQFPRWIYYRFVMTLGRSTGFISVFVFLFFRFLHFSIIIRAGCDDAGRILVELWLSARLSVGLSGEWAIFQHHHICIKRFDNWR